MAHKAPNVPDTTPADRIHYVADLQAEAALDLLSISGKGNFAAQRIRLNNSGAVLATVVFTPEYGADTTIIINPTSSDWIKVPVKALVSCDVATASATIYWWAGNLSNPFNR